jgi:2-oxoglutarate dehydrogenase E2 component (dihydrolipoamide succinyltransferase)
MKVNVVMPKMGESVAEGTIIKWHKKIGDYVKKDEIIFEISTDKVDTEIPSPAEGKLIEIKAFENETVPVETVVAVIETEIDNKEANITSSSQTKQQSKTLEEEKNIIEVVMPKMGESIMEGTIIKWHKKVGDYVKKDEIIFEISTDKVDTEVPSPAEGILSEILVYENQTVAVNTVVAKIAAAQIKPKEQERINEKSVDIEKEENKESVQDFVPNKSYDSRSKSARFYSPVVLHIARAENISFEELDKIQGTGIRGRVTKQDVLRYLEEKKSGKLKQKEFSIEKTPSQAIESKYSELEIKKSETKKLEPSTEFKIEGKLIHKDSDVEIYEMDHIRQKIMNHMIKSRDTSVHVYGTTEVDVTRIEKYIKKNKEKILESEGIKLTYLPFIALACVKSLKKYPLLNASIQENKIIVKKKINLGIAVAIEPNGLIVPNIKSAEEKNLLGLARAINELSIKARSKKLSPDDAQGGTFTITNYGVFGTLFGSPIINQPEVAILGVGSAVKKPVVIEIDGEEAIAIRTMMYLTLTHDHRLIDGMLGGKFLAEVKSNLENFDFY